MTTQRARRRGKATAAVENRYDAAGTGRRLAGWNPSTSGPNRALVGATKIRDRALDAVRNDWSGESSVQKWTTNLVGTGIAPRWDDESIAEYWALFAKVADADGVLDIYGMQALGIRSMVAAGEVFIRRRPRSVRLGLPVPLQIQLIESHFCPIFDADAWPGMPLGNTIRQGIERTKYGERTAYWMYKEHPADFVSSPTQNDLIRIPASEIRHVFEPKRPGQLRGVSSLAPVLVRLRATGDFEDAVLDRQKLANLFTMFITRQMPENWEDIDTDPDTGLPKWYGSDGQPMAGLEPGIAQELKPGENVAFANPPEAGVTFSDYLRTTHMGTAAGQGLPYEIHSGDIRGVSDRALRVVILEFRRLAEQRQWHCLIPMMCQPIAEWFAQAAVLAGVIPRSKLKAASTPEHCPHGWDYLHPVQDVQGKVLAIQNGLTSRVAAITAKGDDPRKVSKDRQLDEELGLNPPPIAEPVDPNAGPGTVPAKPAPHNQAPDFAPMLAAMTQMMAQMTQMVAAMQPSAQAPAQAAGPVIHNHLPAPIVQVQPTPVHIEPAQVSVTNEVQPTAVNVVNEVQPTAVHIEPAQVSVTNQVQPAEVNVNLPERKTESTITRDRDGNIVNVTQVERDLH